MNSGLIYRLYFLYSGKNFGDNGTSKLMNKFTDDRIFLGWSADSREWPNWLRAMKKLINSQDRKFMGQAIIAKVISKRPFRKGLIRLYMTTDTENSLNRYRQTIGAIAQSYPMTCQKVGKEYLRNAA